MLSSVILVKKPVYSKKNIERFILSISLYNFLL